MLLIQAIDPKLSPSQRAAAAAKAVNNCEEAGAVGCVLIRCNPLALPCDWDSTLDPNLILGN